MLSNFSAMKSTPLTFETGLTLFSISDIAALTCSSRVLALEDLLLVHHRADLVHKGLGVAAEPSSQAT